jgi:hypothetical protein
MKSISVPLFLFSFFSYNISAPVEADFLEHEWLAQCCRLSLINRCEGTQSDAKLVGALYLQAIVSKYPEESKTTFMWLCHNLNIQPYGRKVQRDFRHVDSSSRCMLKVGFIVFLTTTKFYVTIWWWSATTNRYNLHRPNEWFGKLNCGQEACTPSTVCRNIAFLVRISVWRPAVLTESFCDLLQSLQANTETAL